MVLFQIKGNRLEAIDEKMINMVKDMNINVIVVVTQAFGDDDQFDRLKQCVIGKFSTILGVPVLAKDMAVGGFPIEAYVLIDLVSVSIIISKSPDPVQFVFATTQAVYPTLKSQQARKMVKWFTTIDCIVRALLGRIVLMPMYMAIVFERIGRVYMYTTKHLRSTSARLKRLQHWLKRLQQRSEHHRCA